VQWPDPHWALRLHVAPLLCGLAHEPLLLHHVPPEHWLSSTHPPWQPPEQV
jgi:hypothetical protein